MINEKNNGSLTKVPKNIFSNILQSIDNL